MKAERTTRGQYPDRLKVRFRILMPIVLLSVLANLLATSGVAWADSRASFVQIVNQADPELRWPEPAPIYYGQELTSQELAASAGVAGTFVYTPSAGTVLLQGTQTLSVLFTPASPNFKSTSTTVMLTVMPPGGGTFAVNPSLPSNPDDPSNSLGRVNVSPESPGVVRLVLTPRGKFVETVTFSCIAPSNLQCTFVPAVLEVDDQPVPFTLTISTDQTPSGGPRPGPNPRQPNPQAVPSAAFFLGAFFLGIRVKRHRLRVGQGTLLSILISLVCLGAFAGVSGCAGADGYSPEQITIVAKSATATRTLALTVFVRR